jgi:hypothetical protein
MHIASTIYEIDGIETFLFYTCIKSVAWSIGITFIAQLLITWSFALTLPSFRDRVTRGEIRVAANEFEVHFRDLSTL